MAEDPYGDIQSREGVVGTDWRWLEALDPTWDAGAVRAGGDLVTTRVRATGTHQGGSLGLEPTGESFAMTATTVSRVEDGKVAEWWSEWDSAGFPDRVDATDPPVYDQPRPAESSLSTQRAVLVSMRSESRFLR